MTLRFSRRRAPGRTAAAVGIALTALFVAGPAVANPLSAAPSPSSKHHNASSSPGPTKRATFGIQPVTNGKPDARSSLTYGITAGAGIRDKIAVINYSAGPLTLAVYATDAVNNSSGVMALIDPNKKPTQAGTWVRVGGRAASGSVTLKAHSYAIVPVIIKVPQGASPGDHVAGVVADLVTPAKRNGVSVNLHQRVGPPVYIRVAGDVKPSLSVENLAVSYHDNWNPFGSGSATVSYKVHNTGNVTLGAHQRVEIDGLFGGTASATAATIEVLLPGSTVSVRVQVPDVFPEIWMNAKVILKPIVPAGNVDPGVHPYSASTHLWAVPWVLIALIGLLVGAAIWIWRWRPRRSLPERHSTNGAAANPKEEVDA
jgi:hypothetical protein